VTTLLKELQTELDQEKQRLKTQRSELDSKRKTWEESQLAQSSAEKVHFPSKIKLDVGGQLFTTSLSTLTQIGGTYFSVMFSGKVKVQPDKEGNYFIDRDPLVFSLILNFLRGILPDFKVLSKKELSSLRSESAYYELDDLQAMMDEVFKRKTWSWLPESHCTLTNGGRTVTKTGGSQWDCIVFGSEEVDAGTVLWEYVFDKVSSDRSGMAIGICKPDTGAGSYSSVIGMGMTGTGYSGVTIVDSVLVTTATKMKVKVSFDTLIIQFFVGTTLVATGTIPSGVSFKCCVFLYYTNDQVTLNFDVDEN